MAMMNVTRRHVVTVIIMVFSPDESNSWSAALVISDGKLVVVESSTNMCSTCMHAIKKSIYYVCIAMQLHTIWVDLSCGWCCYFLYKNTYTVTHACIHTDDYIPVNFVLSPAEVVVDTFSNSIHGHKLVIIGIDFTILYLNLAVRCLSHLEHAQKSMLCHALI